MFMGNGDYVNNGCEAITRGTLDILRETVKNASFIDSYFLSENKEIEPQLGVNVENKPISYPKRWTVKWFILQLLLKLYNNGIGKVLYSSHDKFIEESSVILSLGGDNYSLDYGIPKRFIEMGNYVKSKNKFFVIWGASIGPFEGEIEFEKKLIKHFKEKVDLIFVREEESYNYLIKHGLKEKTHLIADPAFMMKPSLCTNEEIGFTLPQNFISLNFSELMAKYVTDGDIEKWKAICSETVEKLYKKYQLPIILIPHVTKDKKFMEEALSKIKNVDIKMLNEKLNASQMKWVISKSEFLIAARTHATIAAFSTSTPTISLGYSIKSKGLNQLIFNSEDYLIYCNDINVDTILNKTNLIDKERDNIINLLNIKNIKLKEMALNSGKILDKLIS